MVEQDVVVEGNFSLAHGTDSCLSKYFLIDLMQ